MPLQAFDTQSYIRRVRVFVDSDQRDTNLSKSPFDFVYDLGTEYEKVASIELVDFNVRRDISQTFYTKTSTTNGNNFIDVQMRNLGSGAQTLEFTVEIPPRNYTSGEELAADLTVLFNDAMNATADPFFSSVGTSPHTWTVSIGSFNGFLSVLNTDKTSRFYFVATVAVATPPGDYEQSIKFLFGSGPNKEHSAHHTLGFVKADTQDPFGTLTIIYVFSTADKKTPLQLYFGDLQGFPWVDVRVEEVPELDPVARINLADTDLHDNEYFSFFISEITTIVLPDANSFKTGPGFGSVFEIQDGYGSDYYVWYSIAGSTDPGFAGSTGIPVVISAGQSPLEVATATAAAINNEIRFSAEAVANTVIITSNPGFANDLVLTDMPGTTTFTIDQKGVGDYYDEEFTLFPDFPTIGLNHTAGCNNYKNKQTRLLVDPVRRLDKMRIKLTLRDGRDPIEFYRGGVDLVFDLLLISPEGNIPEYVDQRLVY